MNRTSLFRTALTMMLVACLVVPPRSPLFACSFCESGGPTLSQEIARADVVVVVISRPADAAEKVPNPAEKHDGVPGDDDVRPREVRFQIVRFVKDMPGVQRGDEFPLTVTQPIDGTKRYLLFGFGKPPLIAWDSPKEVADAAVQYLVDSRWAAAEGSARLAFFLPHLSSPEKLVREDAYREFAKTPYKIVKELRGKLDREQLLSLVQNADVTSKLRRLYFTLLGMCGQADDAPLVYSLLERDERPFSESRDALIACYLSLAGAPGLTTIQTRYLTNTQANPRDTSAVLPALRFHMTEEQHLSRDQILTAAHQVLDRPELADHIIPDLIAWEDWTVADKLVKLFKTADQTTAGAIRHQVIHYLKARPYPDSPMLIEELRAVDADAVARAELIAPPVPEPEATAAASADKPVGQITEPVPNASPAGSLVKASYRAVNFFILSAILVAVAIALIAVWFLIRSPRRED